MAWSPEQLANAKVILTVGRQLGASDRDITIALMAGWQESHLRNVNYGDRDSIGIFQQRNAWGSRASRLDPYQSAKMFFLGGSQGQRGLLDFKNRNAWGLGQAAQKVQVSAFPDRYDQWKDEAQGMLKELGGMVPPSSTGGIPTTNVDLDGQVTPPTAPEAPPAATEPLGLASPTTDTQNALGVKSPGAPGAESADQMPEFDFTDFLPASTGEPGGSANTFETVFPKGGPVGGLRQRVVDIAKSALGVNYVWGGNSLQNGVDCSGLVQQAFKQVGMNLPRISWSQARYGKKVGLNQLQAGDLVAWDNSPRNAGADHIAIYIGNGQIIEAPRPGLSVRIRSLGKDEGDAWGVSLDY
jgi:cell wall-associated NlpC family hydrolase